MKKLLSLVCIFTAIACQLAQARSSYRYEPAGYGAPEYVDINGARYTRVPHEVVYVPQYRYEQPGYEQQRYEKIGYGQKRYEKPGYEPQNQVVSYDAPRQSTQGVQPYIGFDIGSSMLKLNDKKDKYDLKGLNLKMDDIFDNKHINFTGVAGMKINPRFAVELFYQQAQENDKKVSAARTDFSDSKVEDKLSYKAIGVDMLWLHPPADVCDAIFGVGLAQYKFEGSVTETYHNNTTDNGFKFTLEDDDDVMAMRLGVGLQYRVTDHIAMQAMARYIHMFDDDLITRMVEISLGMRYIF